MRDKFKRLFSGRTLGTEISGSARSGQEASHDSLLSNVDDDNWDAWSIAKDNTGDRSRGRSGRRASNRRSQSEQPSRRKRSKSEVSKRLKSLAVNLNLGEEKSTRSVRGSRSTGGVFRGNRSEVRSQINSLALERYPSDSRISIDDVSSSSTKLTKKLRGGRRKSAIEDISIAKTTGKTPRRSRSVSRSKRSSMNDVGDTTVRVRSSSKKSKRSSSVKGRLSKSMIEFNDMQLGPEDERNSASTATSTTKEGSKKKKKNKKDRRKLNEVPIEDSSHCSVPSKVETNDECQSYGSVTLPELSKAKKKKPKEKVKKSKKKKSKTDFPSLPLDDFGDGLEGLAEEFRMSKEGYVDKKNESTLSMNNDNYNKVSSMFENAWTEIGENSISTSVTDEREKKSHNPFSNDTQSYKSKGANRKTSFTEEIDNNQLTENDLLRQAVDFQVTHTQMNHQQEEISRLQQQLSMALQKQVTMSEDHIQEKDEVLQVSRELEQIKVELAESLQDRDEIAEDLKKRDQIIDDNKNRIDNLEKAIDKQLGKEEELESSLRQSEEEIEKLLDEIQNFERKLESGESVDGGVSFVELRNTKKNLVEKEKTVTSQKLLIEELERELKDSLTVPQLQIEELDQENKGLQGRLKGERLEYTSKLSSRDEIISNLKTKLAGYTASSDALDLQSARQKLNEAREDATTVREDLIAARKLIENLHGDREDLTEKYTLLKENSVFMEKSMKELNEKSDNLRAKVLEWTEKTYNWKQKAESAERKLEACNEEKSVDDNGEPVESENFADAAPQGLLLHAAMEKGKRNSAVSSRSSSWGIFKNSSENQELTAEEIRIRILEEQNHDFEAKVSELNSELVRMQTAHKEELYTTKKKIAQLKGENEALTLQNSTLEQLRET